MRLLLDTHALLWLLNGDPLLESQACDLVTDPANDVFVSSVSLWEITVKLRIGKLVANLPQIISGCRQTGLQFLDITHQHYLRLAGLPVFADHRDPFDHLLIAQAMTEDMVLVSEDRNIPRYDLRFIPCRNSAPASTEN